MTFQWTVSHEARLVTATVSGEVRLGEFPGFFAAIAKAGVLPYRQLVDIRFATLEFHLAEIKQFGRHTTEAGKAAKVGTIATVATPALAQEFAHMYEDSTHADRPVGIFATVEEARAWLDRVAPVADLLIRHGRHCIGPPAGAVSASMNKFLSRRRLLGGLVTATAWHAVPAQAAGRKNLSIIYVSAKDCGPCQVFKHQDLPQWNKSVMAASIRLITIDAPSTSVAYQARHWPNEARPFLAAVKVPVVPTFILVDGRDIVKIGTGLGGWRNQVLPEIPGMLNGEWFRGYQRLG